MKLLIFSVKDVYPRIARLGAIIDKGIIDLAACYRVQLLEKGDIDESRITDFSQILLPNDMTKFLAGGEVSLVAAKEAVKFASLIDSVIEGNEKIIYKENEVKIHTPIKNPPTIRDFLSFEEHYKNSLGGKVPPVWYEIPIYYKTVASSLIGPEEECKWPSYSEIMDYELGFACVIGKRGKNIPADKASEYIAGYVIYNDFSARDTQLKEMEGKLGPAKGKDFCTSIGPYLVTAEEIENVYDLKMTAKVNGEIWSSGNTSTMYRTFEEIIAYVSQSETLVPGDILGSGTVGNGCGLELGKYLKDGDIVELEVEKLGILRNKITR